MNLLFRQRLAGTDREGAGPSLDRLLNSLLADLEFRTALRDLQVGITEDPVPRVLPIEQHTRSGDDYFIEGRLDGDVKPLGDYFAQTPWLQRLRFVRDLTAVSVAWSQRLTALLRLHAGRVVACRLSGQWLAHLAPCPRPPLASRIEGERDLSRAADANIAATRSTWGIEVPDPKRDADRRMELSGLRRERQRDANLSDLAKSRN
jgi:hypothetical protein